jgi:hypothetical protein
MTPDLLPDRIAAKIEPEPTSGCWLWLARLDRDGYGGVSWNGAPRIAHRVVYQLLVGPIPEGLQLDHLCRNRACVSPWHLRPTTPRRNTLARGSLAPTASNAAKTHCKHGHPFDGVNIKRRRDGNRDCRTCRRERQRKES